MDEPTQDELDALNDAGLIDHYRQNKTYYDALGHSCHRALQKNTGTAPTDDDLMPFFGPDVQTAGEFVKYLKSKFAHMPKDKYSGLANKLAKYILSRYRKDIVKP